MALNKANKELREEIDGCRFLRADSIGKYTDASDKRYSLLFVQKGNLTINDTFQMKSGDFMIFPVPIRQVVDDHVVAYLINVSESSIRLLAEFTGFPEISKLLAGEHVRITLDSYRAIEFCKNADAMLHTKVQYRRRHHLLFLFDILFDTDDKSVHTTDEPAWFTDFMDRLSGTDILKDGAVTAVEATGKSYEYVARFFKKHVGQTITAYLNRRRIQKACELLLETGQDLYDIADESGFENLSTFYHVFKAHTGQTPSSFRRSMNDLISRQVGENG